MGTNRRTPEYLEEERIRRRDIKIEVLSHYGKGGTCRCCWLGCTFKDPDTLTLDHINDDGNKNRLPGGRRRGGDGMYRWLKRKGFPQGYQTLCGGHQMKKENMRRRRDSKKRSEE